MLQMLILGKVTKYPEAKMSQKGVAYARVQVESHPTSRKADWGKRVGLTAFGDLVGQVEMLQVGAEVEIVCEPQARGYLDKTGKPAAMLEGVIRSLKVTKQIEPVNAPEPTFDESDIPF